MIDQSTSRGRIVAAALKLAGERPWDQVTYLDIAEAAGLNLAELRREFSSKGDMLAAFSRMIDDQIFARATKPDATLAPRDRLFEVIMGRFDALAPYRSALRSIARAGVADPVLLRQALASQAWMLRAAGITTDGLGGSARVAGLAGVYASVFRTWLDDDDPGMARTMAALDRRLRRGERTLASCSEAWRFVERLGSMFAPSRARSSATSERSYQPEGYPDAPPPMA